MVNKIIPSFTHPRAAYSTARSHPESPLPPPPSTYALLVITSAHYSSGHRGRPPAPAAPPRRSALPTPFLRPGRRGPLHAPPSPSSPTFSTRPSNQPSFLSHSSVSATHCWLAVCHSVPISTFGLHELIFIGKMWSPYT